MRSGLWPGERRCWRCTRIDEEHTDDPDWMPSHGLDVSTTDASNR